MLPAILLPGKNAVSSGVLVGGLFRQVAFWYMD